MKKEDLRKLKLRLGLEEDRYPVFSLDQEFEEEKDIYSEQGANSCCEDDQINPAEEGFMKGYLAA